MRSIFGIVALLAVLPQRADATDFWTQQPVAERTRQWRTALEAATALEQRASTRFFEVRDGRHYIYARQQIPRPLQRAIQDAHHAVAPLVERSLAQYHQAIALRPNHEEAYFRAANMINTFFLASDTQLDRARAEQALELWATAEQQAPLDQRVRSLLLDRAILHTKLGGAEHYRQAIADYERLLRLSDLPSEPPAQVAQIYSNCAEVMMALGQLDSAIQYYETSLRYAAGTYALYAYGLAVALDRDGREGKAREIMANAARYDTSGGVQMAQLRSDGVFFIPEGDVHYYYALGYEALGEFTVAIEQYQLFLRRARDTRYADRARAHLRRLQSVRERK